MKKMISFLLLSCMLISTHITPLQATDDLYYINVYQDDIGKEVASTTNYQEAIQLYESYQEEGSNRSLRYGDRFLTMEYGLVSFTKANDCSYNVSYQDIDTAEQSYTNGCYGIDALYLSSDIENNTVDFYLSGVRGRASLDDVSLLPIETSAKPSHYIVKNDKLYHQIKTQMSDDTYSSSVYLGEKPTVLTNDQEYYSYDGHYFYDMADENSFYNMSDDLQSNTFGHSSNAQMPYYNYYQYVSHRSISAYEEADINQYFENYLGIHASLSSFFNSSGGVHAIWTQSLYKDQAPAFIQYQYQFGANALMMLSLSMNETAMGRSYLAFSRNNLFGHAAYDSAVEENASRYQSVANSIYSHAKNYISTSYLNPNRFQYHGGFFGNKASGMNVSYASDPYWGEKAAQYYVRFDEAMGNKDRNMYTLGIKVSNEDIAIHAEADTNSEVLYQSGNYHDLAFVILEKQGDWYKVQSDPARQADGSYDFQQDIGYIPVSAISHLIEGTQKQVTSYTTINFDAGEGSFENNQKSLSLAIANGRMPSMVAPTQDGFIFSHWSSPLQPASSEMTYYAQYQKVRKAEITTLPKQTYKLDETLDVQGAILTLTSDDGSTKDIAIESSMVFGYDAKILGEQNLQVSYQGISIPYPITVHDNHEEEVATFKSELISYIDSYKENNELTKEMKQALIERKQEMDTTGIPTFTTSEYRMLDALLQKAYGSMLRVYINDDGYQSGVSGLTLATSFTTPSSFFGEALRFSQEQGVHDNAEELLTRIGEANEYQVEDFFTLSLQYQGEDVTLQDDILISMERPKSDSPKDYLLLRYLNGEVYRINASQSDEQIQFITKNLGEYALLSKPSNAPYVTDSVIENNTASTNPHNWMLYITILIGLLIVAIVVVTTMIVRNKRNSKKPPKHKKTKQQIPPKQPSFLQQHQIHIDE